LIEQPRGRGGFGYDPHFLLPDLDKTAAELSAEQKNQLSHRGQALRALLSKLA
jgi:XTP/dITP diphosphohydrolase